MTLISKEHRLTFKTERSTDEREARGQDPRRGARRADGRHTFLFSALWALGTQPRPRPLQGTLRRGPANSSAIFLVLQLII